MERTTDIKAVENMQEFKECLDKCTDCDALASLKQTAKKPNGEYSAIDLQQIVVEVHATVSTNDNTGLVYVELSGDKIKMKKIRELWNSANKRGTDRKMQNKENDYIFILDLINQESKACKLYCLSFCNPWFMSTEEKGLLIALPYDNFKFGIEETSYDEMEYADLEYQRANGRQEAYDEDEDDETFDENDYDDGSEDFINTDDYTTGA